VIASVRKALPSIVAAVVAPAGRITNVDPLPEKVLRGLYAEPQDDDEGIRRFIAAQPVGAE
jgi:hypothetical protein